MIHPALGVSANTASPCQGKGETGITAELGGHANQYSPGPACDLQFLLCVQLDQFHTLMENRQFTVEEQEKAFENIRTDHEKLRRSYLQAKEDYNVLRRSGTFFSLNS